MNCPQCKGYTLEPTEIEPGLVAGSCSKCKGSLLSLMNYRFWVDRYDTVNKPTQELAVAQDNQKALSCPKCSRLMTKFKVGNETPHRIDLCTGCDEAWFDEGEWSLLKQLDLHDKLPKIFTEAWQRNIRVKRQQDFVDQKYQALLGADDFERLATFKKWLDEQPHKEDIKQYLINKQN